MFKQLAVGVFARWETYPPDGQSKLNLLVIEHVNGDQTVSQLIITRRDAEALRQILLEIL